MLLTFEIVVDGARHRDLRVQHNPLYRQVRVWLTAFQKSSYIAVVSGLEAKGYSFPVCGG